MRALRETAIISLVLAATGYGQVWTADFLTDGDFDGMVEFQNGSASKDLFNPGGASAGILQVQTHDGENFGGLHDKGGRLLGTPVTPGASSFSAYYKFAWSQLPEISGDTYTAAGFLGSTQVHITREFVGTVLRHKKEGGDYYVDLGGDFGGVGIGNSGYKGGGYVNLGPSALGATYQLVISWDASTHVIHNALYDASGGLITQNIGDLDSDTDYPNLHSGVTQAQLEADLAATNITHLGWQDWVAWQNLQAVVWDVDQLSYFDSARGAFSVVPEPASALLLTGGLAGLILRRRR